MRAVLLFLVLLTSVCVSASVTQGTFEALSRAQQLIEQEQYAQARTVLEVPGRLTPEEQGWLQYLTAISYLHESRHDMALKFLKRAEQSQGLNQDILIQVQQQIAQVALQQASYQTARDYYRLVLQSRPEQIDLWRGLSYAEYQLNSLVPAWDAINTAIQLAPSPLEADYELRLGIEYQGQKYQASIKTLQTMQDLFEPDAERLRLLVHLHLQQKDITSALATLKIGQSQDLVEPNDVRLLAQLYYNTGAYQRSAEVIHKGISQGVLKSEPEIQQQLLQSYLASRNWTAARDLMLQLPDSEQKAQQLIAVRKNLEDWSGIIEQLKPPYQHNANSWFELGYAHWRLGNDKQAQSAWRQSVVLEPDHMAAEWLMLDFVPAR